MTTIQARPTLYNGIQMRSRLEADYAAALDRRGLQWEYEPICFGGPGGQWLPDFHLPGFAAYAEVKPAGLLKTDGFLQPESVDEILAKMAVAWHSEPSAMLWLVFWEYGARESRLTIGRRPPYPWWLTTPDCEAALWMGMGQYERLTSIQPHGEKPPYHAAGQASELAAALNRHATGKRP